MTKIFLDKLSLEERLNERISDWQDMYKKFKEIGGNDRLETCSGIIITLKSLKKWIEENSKVCTKEEIEHLIILINRQKERNKITYGSAGDRCYTCENLLKKLESV